MARLARVLQGEELRVEAGELPHARTLCVAARRPSSAGAREPLRRHPSRRGACSSTSTSCYAAYRREPPGPRLVRDLRPPRHIAQGHVHRSPRPRHQRGDRAPPKSGGDQPGRCSSRATRTRSPSPRSTPRSASSAPTASTSASTPTTATRRRPRSATRSSPPRQLTGSCSRRRTTRPRTAATSTTRRAAGRRARTSPSASRTRPTALLEAAPIATRRGAARRRTTTWTPTSTTFRT